MYNRRQKRLFYAVQASLYQEALLSAIEAEKAGRELTEDERGAINRERLVLKAEQEAEDRKRRRWEMLGVGSLGEGVKRFFVGGLGMGDEEEGGEREVVEAKMAAIGGGGAVAAGEGKTVIGKVEDVVSPSRVMQALQEQQQQRQQKSRPEAANPAQQVPAIAAAAATPGGDFDKLAENVADAAGEKAKGGGGGGGGWSSWFGGK